MVEEAKPGEEKVLRKSKSFKRIRGFLRGDKKKKKDKKKGDTKPKGDEESTVYGVDVDERSAASRNTLESKKDDKAFLLKVVLLLMDPETRRFELLQLEFDSLKALVSDVLAQIPVSVTEESLRKQAYTGICGYKGIEMTENKLLADFCQGNEVLVAIPTGVSAKECARLARPILGDEKVIAMVSRASEIRINEILLSGLLC